MLRYIHYQHGLAMYHNTAIMIPTTVNETTITQHYDIFKLLSITRTIHNYLIYSTDYSNCIYMWDASYRIDITAKFNTKSVATSLHGSLPPLIYTIPDNYFVNPIDYYYLVDIIYPDLYKTYVYNRIPFIRYGVITPNDGILSILHYNELYSDYI